MRQQCMLATQKANCILAASRGVVIKVKEVTVPFYSALLSFHLEYCVQAREPHYSRDVKLWNSSSGGPQR